jgi:hypothetical protein
MPDLEITDELIAELVAESGSPGAGRGAFRFRLEFEDEGRRSTCAVGLRWKGSSRERGFDESLPWVTLAIIETGAEYVEDRVGQGRKIAARIPRASVVSAQEGFPPTGFPISFVRRRDSP